MAELSIVDGVFNLKVTQGTTSRFANGVDEESVEAAILVETNARIAADVYARPYPPTSPTEGRLWLRTIEDVRAVVDFRAYDDGEPSLGDPDDANWDAIDRIIATPTYVGSNTHAKLIDFSGEFAGMYTANTPSIVSGVMRSPAIAESTIHTVAGIALTATRAGDGPMTSAIHRFTICVDDLRIPSSDDDDALSRSIHRVGVFGYGGVGSGSNGPCVEVRVDWDGVDPVCRINAAWASPTEIDPSGSTLTSIDRLLVKGDRITCAVDFVNNQWWAELNGVEVEDTRMGANTDFDTMDDLDDGVTTNLEQYKMMLFSAGCGVDNWESGVIWAAHTLSDYAPELVTIFKYDGADWVPEIVPAIAVVPPAATELPTNSAWTTMLPTSNSGIAKWIDPLVLFGNNPSVVPRGLAYRTLANGDVQVEGLALWVNSGGAPTVPGSSSTIATLPPGFRPLTRPPMVQGTETDTGTGAITQTAVAINLDGTIVGPASPVSQLFAIIATFTPA